MRIFEFGYGKFHLVGFSLGAQVVGLIGRKVIEKSHGRFKIPRITGLDPGKMPEMMKIPIVYLNEGDAIFVDTIHSENDYFGSAISSGNSSFLVNGGKSQPMCKSSLDLGKFSIFTIFLIFFIQLSVKAVCSHLMAPIYWTESVKANGSIFTALKCDSYESFKIGDCNNFTINSMGIQTDLNLNGKFYVDTNLMPPYSKN